MVKQALTIEKDYLKIVSTLELYCYLKYKLNKHTTEDIIGKVILFHLEHKDKFNPEKSSLITYLELKCSNFILDMYRSNEYKNVDYYPDLFI